MNKKIYLVTGKNDFFGQFRKPWISLNTSIIIDTLQKGGFQVIKCEFHQLANNLIDVHNSIIVYTFSQKKEIREYIKDVIYTLKLKNNLIIPDYDLLLCHEDKGFQELYRKHLSLSPLKSIYFSDINELKSYDIEYPCVLKTVDGSNGRGVFLIHNQKELHKKIVSLYKELDIITKLDLLRRKYFRHKKTVKGWPEFDPASDYDAYKEYVKTSRNLVIQKFIPDLKYDFRVLAVHDHFYVTKRHVKDGDFRASGTKLFDFDTGDVNNILNFAKAIHQKINHPFLSMDIAVTDDKLHLLEFQALHFGNNVIKLSNGFYKKENDAWLFIEKKPDVNLVLANGLLKYLDKLISYTDT